MSIPIKLRVKDSIVAITRRFGWFRERRCRAQIARWQEAGKPVPPPHPVKERIVLSYASTFGAATFIETGTFLGEMLYAVKDVFPAIFSIELNNDLCKRAKNTIWPGVQVTCSGRYCPD